MMLYDVFICHAGEDKEEFVRPLANRLMQEHIEVWYDEFSLKLGDSLRRSIEHGLTRSRYGIVVLSPSFFNKHWPQRELDGLFSKEANTKDKVILPIWHQITKEEVYQHSPLIADTVAVSSDKGLEEVVRHIVNIVRPQGSPLIIAREHLIKYGLKSPVVTDEWWIDLVETSMREPCTGFALHLEPWGRWTFPLPDEGNSAKQRGERLAWTAMQAMWEQEAATRQISQISEPHVVIEFINSQKGLKEVCYKYPEYLACYAPQLTIRGLGDAFEDMFEQLLISSVERSNRMIMTKGNENCGSALTTSKKPPVCDEFIALRHQTFGNYQPGFIACQFVQGDIGGPSPKLYDPIDYIVWLLSNQSKWLPENIRAYLLDGMKEWNVWLWWEFPTDRESAFGLKPYPKIGALANTISKARNYNNFKLTEACKEDIENRFSFTIKLLGIKQSSVEIMNRFLDADFIKAYYRKQREIKKAQHRYK